MKTAKCDKTKAVRRTRLALTGRLVAAVHGRRLHLECGRREHLPVVRARTLELDVERLAVPPTGQTGKGD